MILEIYTDEVRPPWVINFGSVADPVNDEKLFRLRERNRHMRIERTAEGNIRVYAISDDHLPIERK